MPEATSPIFPRDTLLIVSAIISVMPPKKKATKKTPKAGDAERGTPSPKPKPANEDVEMGSSEQVEAAAPPETTQKSAAPKKKVREKA